MKKILFAVIASLMFLGMSLHAAEKSGETKSKCHNKIIKEFKKQGGSDKGVKILQESFAKKSSEMKEFDKEKTEIKKLQTQLISIIKAEKFEVEKYKETREKIMKLNMKKMEAKMGSDMSEALSKLSKADREVIAKILEKKHKEKKHRK